MTDFLNALQKLVIAIFLLGVVIVILSSLYLWWASPNDPVPNRIFEVKVCIDKTREYVKTAVQYLRKTNKPIFEQENESLRRQYEEIAQNVRGFASAAASAAQRDGLSEHTETLVNLGSDACNAGNNLYKLLNKLAGVSVESVESFHLSGYAFNFDKMWNDVKRAYDTIRTDRKEKLKRFEKELQRSLWPKWVELQK